MLIKRIETIPIRVPQKPYRDAYNVYTSSAAVITKVQTDEGIIGYGESSAFTPEIYGESIGSITVTIRDLLAPLLIGKDPFQIEHLSAIMEKAAGRAPCAKTGLDLALYDILGKKMKQPVSNLLGGKLSDSVVAAFEIGIKGAEEMAREAAAWVEKGLKVVKIKAGYGGVEKDIQRIKAVSDAVGPGIQIRVDPNAHWSVADCVKASDLLRKINLDYLEQPLPPWDFDGMAEVRRVTGLQLEADEAAWTSYDVVEIAKRRSADVVNLKIPKVGGLLKAKKMAAVAEAAGMACMAGAEGEVASAVGAKLHLAASTPNATRASDFTELSLLEDWPLKDPPELTKDGLIEVPQQPGLGMEIDEDKLKRWTAQI